MQTEPGSIPGSGEVLAKFSRNYAELYWEFNEPISRPLGGQKVPRNWGLMCPFILYTQKSTIESYTEKVRQKQNKNKYVRHVRHSCDHVLLGHCSVGTFECWDI